MEEQTSIYIIVALIIFCIWLYAKLRKERKQRANLAKENSKLIADNALFEAEQLKFQLQPHTLNNILAHLKVTANKLNKGLASLSETLEYILYKGQNHLVTVEEELGFIQEYLRLNELFIAEIDAIKVDTTKVDKHSAFFSSPCIPHLVTAYFLENAFKHGNINERDALKITLSLNDQKFEMSVSNKMKQKLTSVNGGIGLNNMKKRLELLASSKYDIQNNISDNEFHSTLIIHL